MKCELIFREPSAIGVRPRNDLDRDHLALLENTAMNRLLAATAVALLLSMASPSAFAKRGAPVAVPSVRQGNIEFRVKHESGNGYMPGFVEAFDTAKNGQVWLRQIYVIRRDPDLEGDVQDVFITGVQVIADRNVLEITHERGGVFELNLETLEVKAVKGQAVIQKR
jgi:hypothetical protein